MSHYAVERANADSQRRHYERNEWLNTEVILRTDGEPPRIICLATWSDAQRIAAALNGAKP